MSNLTNKVENSKDKVVGKTKEAAGRATGSQEMELKGKLQYKKGDLKDKVDKTKENLTEKFNDTLDKK
ncbi:CsbD family protein [Clostridium tagluense]|uniref:CsbD family protein n=1 Tax=Clostridium tagluense TaxID=360422 RepID=UPI001CF5E808|nr:CsbD family protein [Clostridium tagluense]MCB2300156.1 CsbD family protein [Clostridium tagluense]